MTAERSTVDAVAQGAYAVRLSMPTTRTILRCMIISPGDVEEEREAVRQGIVDFNAHLGEALGVSVEATGWETHATPQMGAEPQAILNRQVVDACDLAIAVFWTRMGTATDAYPSGSAEEVARLRERGVPVMVYFSDKPAEPSRIDAAQFTRLRQLRDEYRKEGYLETFDTVAKLRHQVTLHVTSQVSQWLAANRAGAEGASARPGFIAAPLPDVRVRVDLVELTDSSFKGGVPYVRISAENHSPQTVFLTGPSFATGEANTWVMTGKDSTGAPAHEKRRLESGDSTYYLYEPEHVERIVRGEPRGIVVNDAVHRRFRAPDGALAAALERHKMKATEGKR